MKTFQLALVASVLSLCACQRDTSSDETAANGFGTNDIVVDDGTANLTNTASSGVDPAFVIEAIKGDNGEVAIGNLAAAQAGSQAAKDFGRTLVADHGGHKQKLLTLASSAGISPTEEPSDEARANLEKLKSLKGAEFDKEFKRMMVEDHEKDIAKYEQQVSTGDPQTSALAKETLPTLRKHLATAKSL
jgi:putative membrane protein